jgi:hypothetical protein
MAGTTSPRALSPSLGFLRSLIAASTVHKALEGHAPSPLAFMRAFERV